MTATRAVPCGTGLPLGGTRNPRSSATSCSIDSGRPDSTVEQIFGQSRSGGSEVVEWPDDTDRRPVRTDSRMFASALAGRAMAVAAAGTRRAVLDRRADRIRRPRRRDLRELRSGGRAGLADRGRQPCPRCGRGDGSPTHAWPSGTWPSRGTGHSSPTTTLLPSVLGALADRNVGRLSDFGRRGRWRSRRARMRSPIHRGVRHHPAEEGAGRSSRAAEQVDHETPGHVPRRKTASRRSRNSMTARSTTPMIPTCSAARSAAAASSASWLKKMLSSARKTGSGGGPPGADSPTHRTNSANRGAVAVSSTGDASRRRGSRRPRRRVHVSGMGRRIARATGRTGAPCARSSRRSKASATQAIDDAHRRAPSAGAAGHGSASPPPSAAGRRHRHRRGGRGAGRGAGRIGARRGGLPRQPAAPARPVGAVAARRLGVDGRAGHASAAPCTSSSATAVAALTVALHDLGDRVALYAYYSQGRAAVNMVPVKRFDDHLDARVIRRLNSLEPGAYSRLGAAIRHGSAVLEAAAVRRAGCWW